MTLDFVKISPTQNMTILVTSPVDRSRQVSAAEKLMSPGSVQAEQVGYLEKPSLPGAQCRLQMMGGEFCGNATMSLGAYLAFRENLPDGAAAVYPLEVSGADGLISCRILRRGDAYLGTVAMPLPEKIEEVTFANGMRCPVVFLPGIAHAIVDAKLMTPDEARSLIAAWCEETRQEAFGILLRSGNAMQPLVYVRETNSAVWENGCGSGTASLGAYEASLRNSSVSMEISQPGGVIRADVVYEGGFTSVEITGSVRIAATGQAFI